MAAEPVSSDAPPAVTWVKIRDVAWQLLTGAVGSIFRYRVTGLAAEAAFFAILSLPPLIFGLAGTIGYFADRYDVAEVDRLQSEVLDLAWGRFVSFSDPDGNAWAVQELPDYGANG